MENTTNDQLQIWNKYDAGVILPTDFVRLCVKA